MIPAISRTLAALAAVAATAATGHAGPLEWSAGVHGSWSQYDSWSVKRSTSGSRLIWGGGFSLMGAPFRPGLLAWSAGASYNGQRADLWDDRDRTGRLTGGARIRALANTKYPVTLGVSRRWEGFLNNRDGDSTGSAVHTGLFGSVSRVPEREAIPSLSMTLGHTHSDFRDPLGAETFVETNSLNASLAQGRTASQYFVTYGTGWNRGTYDESNYRNHEVSVGFDTAVDALPGGEFNINERYTLRVPARDAVVNPRVDQNGLTSSLRWYERDAWQAISYGYNQAAVSITGGPVAEQISHSLSWRNRQTLSSTTAANYGASFRYAEQRAGEVSGRGAANLASATLEWSKPGNGAIYQLVGGGAAGLSSGGPSFAYSLTGGASVTSGRLRRSLTLGWNGSMSGNTSGVDGSNLSHQLYASGSRQFANGGTVNASLRAETSRTSSEVLGVDVARQINLITTLNAGGVRGTITLLVHEGVDRRLSQGGDGLLFPPEFDSRSYGVYLTTRRSFAAFRGVATMRSLWTDLPSARRAWQHAGAISVVYQFGKLSATLSEAISIGGNDTEWQLDNSVRVSLARSFGGPE